MRAGLAVLAGLAGLASCDRVFGLEGHDLPDTDGAVGGAITGTFVRQVIANDDSPARLPTPSEAGLAGSDLALELRVGSTTTPVPVASNGSFELAARAPYALVWRIDGGVPIELQSSAAVLSLVDLWVGRADRTPVTKPTPLTFDLPAVGSDEFLAVQSTGLWADVGADETPGATTFGVDWHAVTDAHHAPGLLDAGKHDRLYALFYHHIADGTHDYDQMIGYLTDDVTQTDGTAQAVSGTRTTLTPGTCTEIITAAATDGARLAAADSRYMLHDSSWAVVGIPIGARDNTGVNYLAGDSLPTVTNVDTMIQYGDPYPGVTEVAVMTAGLTRPVQLGGAAPTTFAAATQEVDQVLTGCQATMLGGRFATITSWTLAGQPLVADDTPLTVGRDTDLEVAFTASSGLADYYQIDLVELGTAAGATTMTTIHTYWTTEPVVHVDPALLAAGGTYALDGWVQVGVPGAASGDFKSLAFPRGFTVIASRTFTVAN